MENIKKEIIKICPQCGKWFGNHEQTCMKEYDKNLDILTRNVFGTSLEEALKMIRVLKGK